jgi:hypothetical protein
MASWEFQKTRRHNVRHERLSLHGKAIAPLRRGANAAAEKTGAETRILTRRVITVFDTPRISK